MEVTRGSIVPMSSFYLGKREALPEKNILFFKYERRKKILFSVFDLLFFNREIGFII